MGKRSMCKPFKCEIETGVSSHFDPLPHRALFKLGSIFLSFLVILSSGIHSITGALLFDPPCLGSLSSSLPSPSSSSRGFFLVELSPRWTISRL
ncbi:hypothetical protein Scep_019312 [Stephania cephalantha]|uniref:Uncharacterized protein n=1 Tax=Stephania cephalantha TaxID=152367 RepID=A0AAP0IAK8_9MAGN